MSDSDTETAKLIHSSADNNIVRYYSESSKSQHNEVPADTNYEPKVYRVRWWVLFVFCLFVCNQACCGIVWMPLCDALLIAYEWNVSEIGMANAFTSLAFLISALPVMYLTETKGIRVGVILANLTLIAASLFWILSLFTHEFWLFVIGAIFNGIAATVALVLPSLVSVTWFPVSQRTTATSLSVLSLNSGVLIGFIAGPQISGGQVTAEDVTNRNNLTTVYVEDLTHGLQHVGFFVSGLNVAGLILAIAYFPASPPSPPSASQTVKREDFLSGLRKLGKNSQYWILCVAFLTSNALVAVWLPLISVTFRPLGIDEATASWMGSAATLAGCGFILLISVLGDQPYFKRKTKLFLIIFSGNSIVLLFILVCIQKNVIYLSDDALVPVLYILVIGVAVSTISLFPLYSELACEHAFPVHEGLACTVLMLGKWAVSLLLYEILLIPALSESTGWMTWACLGGSCVTFPLLMPLKDNFTRLDLDENRYSMER